MSAQAKTDQAPEMVSIEVDGQTLEVPKGAMIIEATDKAGIDIPRFCYHKKLSIAANCRMCLVDVEKAPKPLPACATPVMDGMKVYTESRRARDAQQGVMEFLLINHPLDCPICDQGGECELQDLAMGYGRSVSRFTERKRAVKDKNIGPLISTDMTRCIHCTRCVRFLDEIAGTNELGGIGRGENMEISTFVARNIDSELSGNIIDLCPVGALTNKPFRFSARAWELIARPMIANHDSLGSNLWYHVRRGQIMRSVPRDNEAVNETWLSDRDRYSHFGLYHEDRLTTARIKRGDSWETADWDSALAVTKDILSSCHQLHGAEQIGILTSPQAITEDQFALARFAQALGGAAIDYRLRSLDADDTGSAHTTLPLAGLSAATAVLLVGSNLRHEQPLLAQRLRQAWLRHAARISTLNAVAYDWHFDAGNELLAGPQHWLAELGGILQAAYTATNQGLTDDALGKWLGKQTSTEQHQRIAQTLIDGERAILVLGAQAAMHPDAGLLRQLLRRLAEVCEAERIELDYAANGHGAQLAGALSPDRHLLTAELARQSRRVLILHDIDPALDCANPQALLAACQQADKVIAISSYVSDSLRAVADVILPKAAAAETGGTLHNLEGRAQRFAAAAKPQGEARATWKIIRILSEQLKLDGCQWRSADELQQAMDQHLSQQEVTQREARWRTPASPANGLQRLGAVPMYSVDALCRHSLPLQQSIHAQGFDQIVMHSATAAGLKLAAGDQAKIEQGEDTVSLAVAIDDRVAADTALLPAATNHSAQLGAAIGAIQVQAAAASGDAE